MNSTNGYLHSLLNDIQRQSLQSPAFAYLHKAQIKRLLEHNQYTINKMNAAMQVITQKYCVHGMDGQPVIKDGQLQFNNQLDGAAFVKEVNELMALPINLNV